MKSLKVLFDLIHPANFHYFKNTIEYLNYNGHKVRITAREKDVMFSLLKSQGYSFFDMGKSRSGKWAKLFYLLKSELYMFLNVLYFRPDFIISFSSSFAAHNAWLFGIPHITFDDTEHHKLNRKLYAPFTKVIFTPDCFMLDLGKKQIRFPAFMELFYLHPALFIPDKTVLKDINVSEGEVFFLLRFVSWGAYHDIGQSGITLETKLQLIKLLTGYGKIFISSEGELPNELEKYRINISPEKIHHVMAYATLFIGEGSTMASESAILGTHAVYVNSLELGYMNVLESRFGLVTNFRNNDGLIDKITDLVSKKDLKEGAQILRKKMISQLINPTKMLIWFLENYPQSQTLLKTNKELMKQF